MAFVVKLVLFVVVILVLAVVMTALPAAAAASRGRSWWRWGLAGLVFGPFLLPVLYALPRQASAEPVATAVPH